MRTMKICLALMSLVLLAACEAEAAPLFDENREDVSMKEKAAVYVDIKGAIRNPGVYKVKEGRRLIHLIELAGGTREDASLEGLILSEMLSDGKVYTIPSIHDTSKKAEDEKEVREEPDEKRTKKVSLNHASKEALETLPSIGPATAQAILDYREENGPFETKEALMDVKNIGIKTFEDLEDLITLQP
ncbi:MAG: helix-hairpin-helix domain-containing protein [Bacillota bacterium]